MFAFLTEQAHAHWLWIGIGCLLFCAEMLGASGYLLWSGFAAILVGIFVWLMPFEMSLSAQATIYAVTLVINTYLWWRWLKKRAAKAKSNFPLNERNQQLIGQRALLLEDVHQGISRVKLGDSSWRVSCSDNLLAGEEVEIFGVDGVTLLVKKTLSH